MPRATTALAVVLVITSGTLAGCGGGNPYALPKYDAEAAAVSQPRSTIRPADRLTKLSPAMSPPTPVEYRPADPFGAGAWVERGKIVARSGAQLAAVDAMAKYLTVWVQLSNTWQVDEQALGAVASGEAVTNARERAEHQREQNRRSIGRFIINVSSVKVSGSSATVTGCDFDATSEVDQDGNVLIGPPGGVLITMELRRTAGTWRVIESPDHATSLCDWRS
jgi:predicted small lipoprotein YifL